MYALNTNIKIIYHPTNSWWNDKAYKKKKKIEKRKLRHVYFKNKEA